MENYWPGAGARPSATRHEKSHAAWYNQAQKVVLSRTLRPEGLMHTEIIRDNLAENIQALKQSDRGGSEDILLFGSPTATHALMQQQLIDGYWLFVNPWCWGRASRCSRIYKNKLNLICSPPTVSATGSLN